MILPIIPAFIIFKFLPRGKVIAKGPFKGFNLQLTGSFAGYFIVLLFAAGFYLILTQKNSFEPYSVSGCIRLEQGEFSKNKLSFSVEPPNPEKGLYEDGRFSFDGLLIFENGKTKPSLLIQKDGYKTTRVHLDENLPKIEGLPHYKVIYNTLDKIIIVKDQSFLKKTREKVNNCKKKKKMLYLSMRGTKMKSTAYLSLIFSYYSVFHLLQMVVP